MEDRRLDLEIGPGPHASAIGVFTTDTTLTVRTWDDWLAAATGIPSDHARGRALMELVPDITSRGLLAPFQQVLSAGVVEILAPAFHRYLIPCPPAGGSAAFDRMQQRVTIGPLREDGRIVGTIVAVEDVTARVERERELTAQLSSLDPDARLRAAEQLAAGELLDGVGPLVGALGDESWRVRRTAVKALGRRNTSDVIAAVLQSLRDDHRNFSVLSSAIELLAATDVDVVEPLLDLLGHPDPDLRLQAALVLGERADDRAVAGLIAALADPDENLRFHAIEALGKLKAIEAVDPLVRIAESGHFFLGFPAVEALARIGDATVAPRLAALMKHELLRGTAAEALGLIGDEDVVAPLVQLLNETSAPTDVVAEALANIYDRYQERYRDGEHVAHLVRQTITPTGTQNLLDAVRTESGEPLKAIATVLGWLDGPAVDRALTRLLGESSVRGKVVEYLVRHGGGVVELLIEQLGAEDLEVRQAAVVGLGRIGDRRATAPLVGVLTADPALTIVAAGALARIGDPDAFRPLLALLRHADAAVRQAAIAALNSIGHPEMAVHVSRLLHDPQRHVRESAVRIAGYFGYRECADALLACSRDDDPGVQRAAVEHLGCLDDPRVVPTLVDALASPNAVTRAAAAQALARVEDPRVLEPLVAALKDPDPWVRYFAVRAIAEQRHEAAIDEITRLAFDDPAGHVRLAAVTGLGRIGSASTVPALAALAAATEDDERSQRAIEALGVMGHPDAWPPLERALRDGDDSRRIAAAESIARFGGETAVEALEWAAAADASPEVAAAAIAGLGRIAAAGPGGRAAVRSLTSLAADADRRALAISGLAAIPPGLIEELAQGLRNPRPPVRIAILQALGRLRDVNASRWLQTALDDEAAEVRVAALKELRHLGTRGLEHRLARLAAGDPDAAVRRAARAVLRREPAARPE